MYSNAVTKATLDKLQSRLSFNLSPCSLAKSEHYRKHFNKYLDPDSGELPEGFHFRKDELAYIQSERMLCKYDFRYWAARYGYIKSTLGWDSPADAPDIIAPIKYTIAQSVFLDVCSEMEEMGIALMLLCHKARQLGLSTISALLISHRVLFYKLVNALIAAATPDTTRKMSDMTMRVVSRQPYWLVPPVEYYKSGETLLEVLGLESAITLQHGAQYTGLSRGDTPNVAHLSEVSSFQNPEEDIDSSLLQAMHEDPLTVLILESTAMELNDWWHKKWKHYTKAWPLRQGRLRPMFLPWFIGTDVWPPKNWIRGHPMPSGWEPPHDIRGYAKRAEESVVHDPLLLKYLGAGWQLPRIQQWFYYCDIEEARATKTLGLKLREMPTTAAESFQTANTTVFDIETINELEAQRRSLLGCFGVECSAFPQKFWPERRDKLVGGQPVNLKAEWSNPRLSFDLVPLKVENYPDPEQCVFENRIFIWEAPQRGYDYFIGVDTAYGLNQDRCAIEVLKKGDVARPAIQVAEYASGYIDAINLTYVLAALATLYSTSSEPCLVIECRGPGDQTQHEIRKWGWGNFHLWEKVDNRRRSRPSKLGWYTTSWSRDNLVVKLNKAIKDFDVEINSPWLINELRTLSKDEMQQAIRAERGSHDDLYMAIGMAFYSAHCWESMMGRDEYSVNQQRRLDGLKPQRDPNEEWERRWKAGEHLFDFALPSPVSNADEDSANPAIVRSLDDEYDPNWFLSHN